MKRVLETGTDQEEGASLATDLAIMSRTYLAFPPDLQGLQEGNAVPRSLYQAKGCGGVPPKGKWA